MGLYTYSSALRRALKTSLEAAAAPFSVAVIGHRPLEALLFRNVASVIDCLVPDDTTRSLAQYDVILCGMETLPALYQRLSASDGNPEPPIVKAIAVHGKTRGISSTEIEWIATLCRRMNLTLLDQQTETTNFGQDSESVFLLVRKPDTQGDSPLDLLKLAVFIEAHSLHAAALDVIDRYNAQVYPDRM